MYYGNSLWSGVGGIRKNATNKVGGFITCGQQFNPIITLHVATGTENTQRRFKCNLIDKA